MDSTYCRLNCMQELYLSPRAAAARGANSGSGTGEASHFRLRNPKAAAARWSGGAGMAQAAVPVPVTFAALNLPEKQVCTSFLESRFMQASETTAGLINTSLCEQALLQGFVNRQVSRPRESSLWQLPTRFWPPEHWSHQASPCSNEPFVSDGYHFDRCLTSEVECPNLL